jgi:hypothetical protein
MVLLCVLLSFLYDQDLVPTTLCLVAVTYTYDELGAASNIVGKALCTAGGYASFEVGATTIISKPTFRKRFCGFADADDSR